MNLDRNSDGAFAIGGVFDDIDHFSEVTRAWNLDFYQLGRGSFEASLFQVGNCDFQLGEARFSRSLEQNGLPPAGMRTFAIPVDPSMALRWRGFEVTGNHLMIFPRGGELYSISKPGFHIFTFSIAEEALMAASEMLGYPDVAEILKTGVELISVEPKALAVLVSECRALIESTRLDLSAARVTHERITALLVRVLMQSSAADPAPPRSQLRSQAIRKARDVVMDWRRYPVTVGRLSKETGVSVRTLQYAFAEEFSMTPKSWLKARSLNQVRRRLRQCRMERTKISDVANDWGFWHMGQFARDYRQAFGELPSETLGK